MLVCFFGFPVNCPFISFVHFSTGVGIIFLFITRNSLNILDVNLLLTLDLINTFSYSVCMLMNFMVCFVEENP